MNQTLNRKHEGTASFENEETIGLHEGSGIESVTDFNRRKAEIARLGAEAAAAAEAGMSTYVSDDGINDLEQYANASIDTQPVHIRIGEVSAYLARMRTLTAQESTK